MSKEPDKREVEQEPKAGEGWKHGYSPEQIKLIEDARGEPKLPTPVAEEKEEGQESDYSDPADPDELEDELEQAREEGDYAPTHRSKPKTKR